LEYKLENVIQKHDRSYLTDFCEDA